MTFCPEAKKVTFYLQKKLNIYTKNCINNDNFFTGYLFIDISKDVF